MTVHYHYKQQPITVHTGSRGFSEGLGFRVVTQCERCGFKTDKYHLFAGVYMCDNCYCEYEMALRAPSGVIYD
jgi:hypothetical protein